MQESMEESKQPTLAFTVTLVYAVLRRQNRSVETRSKQPPSWVGTGKGLNLSVFHMVSIIDLVSSFHAHLLKPYTSPEVGDSTIGFL